MNNDITLDNLVIVGIDPGISHMGLSAIYVSPDLSTIYSIYNTTIHSKDSPENISSFYIDNRYSITEYHYSNLINWLSIHNPHYVVYEEPFFYFKSPAAYGALVESICVIRNAVHNYNPYIYIFNYRPKHIKLSVHATSYQGKVHMKDAILKIPEIYNNIINNIDRDVDEHGIDSIAVAYTHLQHLRMDNI